MLTVIADDITGAAEIAGIGLRFGMCTALVFEARDELPEAELLVYATDTRSMSEAEAVETTRRVIRQLKATGCRKLFKKTDSALRGHLVAELNILLAETGRPRAILLPENPSKGRIVRDGVYLIDGVPLDRTTFADDPEFPARTADVMKRLPGLAGTISPGTHPSGNGIFLANAENAADVETCLTPGDKEALYAGGADLFTACLRRDGRREKPDLPEFEGLGSKKAIVICGSTVRHPLNELDYFQREQVPLLTMPRRVFEQKDDPGGWFETLNEAYESNRSIAIAVGHPPQPGAECALRLRNTMALAASSLVDIRLPDELIIEGGATAFAVLHALGWSRFRITDEVAPGVVRMALDTRLCTSNNLETKEVHITLKPGSYPWGDRIFR
jgi:hypothetical protein